MIFAFCLSKKIVLVVERGAIDIPIQCSKSSSSSVWKTNDGNFLPYLPSNFNFNINSLSSALMMFNPGGSYVIAAIDHATCIFPFLLLKFRT